MARTSWCWYQELIVGAVLALCAGGCRSSDTGLIATVKLAESAGVDQLSVRLRAEAAAAALPDRLIPAQPAPIKNGTTVLLLLPESWGGTQATVEIGGLKSGKEILRGSATAAIRTHEIGAVLVELTQRYTVPAGCEASCVERDPQLCAPHPEMSGSCVECTLDSHCQNNPFARGPKCQLEAHTCICAQEADCAEIASGAKCIAERCGCDDEKDCKVDGTKCLEHVCRKPCTSNADCLGQAAPVCNSAGTCVACAADKDCATSGKGAYCASEAGVCGCRTDADCKSGSPDGNRCLPGAPVGRCGCAKSADCVGSPRGPACYWGLCTCQEDANCTKTPNVKCTPTSTLPISSQSYALQCGPVCTTDADCAARGTSPELSLCANGRCAACRTDADCAARAGKHCSLGRCVECGEEAHCASNVWGSRCDKASGRCGCSTDSHCRGLYPEGNRCAGGACTCSSNPDCTGNPHGPTCSTTFGQCTCESDADCTKAPYSHCAPLYGGTGIKECKVACSTDADCGSPSEYPHLPRCLNSVCAACTTTADCLASWNDDYHACDTTNHTCIVCTQDSHCKNHRWGPTCNRVGHPRCICASDADCIGRAATNGNKCNQPGDFGTCSCSSSAECVGHLKGALCNTTSSNCYCKQNTDCPAGYRCPPSDREAACHKACSSDAECKALGNWPRLNYCLSGSCVECKSNSDCNDSPNGNTCSPAGLCSCSADKDCLGAFNGMRCLQGATRRVCKCQLDADCIPPQKCDTSAGVCDS